MLNQEQIKMLLGLLNYEEEFYSDEYEGEDREDRLELVKSTVEVLENFR